MGNTLEKAGYNVTYAASGESAFSRLRYDSFDLILLDLFLGDTHGMEILKLIRRQNDALPVIIVSSCTDLDVKVNGFEIGCDDYLTKPFFAEELLSRVKRQLKRVETFKREAASERIIENIDLPPFRFNIRSCEVFKNGEPIPMRRKLFDLFLLFAQNPNQTLPKETILANCWNDSEDATTNTLYVHINQLRGLIESDQNSPRYIQTIRGVGFRFCVA